MKRPLPLVPVLGAAGLALLAGVPPALAAPPGSLPFGVYDPGGDFINDGEVAIEHVFLPWEDVSLESLVAADQYAQERNRVLLVSVEPWTWTRDERNTPAFLQQGIHTGYYDANMRSICQVIDTLESPVTIRWAHEMEYTDGQFIWAGWEPEDYVAAYRRMVDICREAAPRVNVMWSPLGLEGMEEYYPGDDYVDLIGLTIFGYQAYEEDVFGRPMSYGEFLDERYARAAVFGKPIVVGELGYTGCQDYVDAWDSAVRQPQPDKPLLVGVVYFNQQEVYPWPNRYGPEPWPGGAGSLPDWRVDHRVTGNEADGTCGVQANGLEVDLPVIMDEVFEK